MNKQAFTITYTTRLIWEDKFSPPLLLLRTIILNFSSQKI